MGLNCLYDINDESRNVLAQKLVLGQIQVSSFSDFKIELKLGSLEFSSKYLGLKQKSDF